MERWITWDMIRLWGVLVARRAVPDVLASRAEWEAAAVFTLTIVAAGVLAIILLGFLLGVWR